MSFQVISSHFKSFQVISSHIKSYQVISSHLKSFKVISSHFILCHFMSLHVKSYHSCQIMSVVCQLGPFPGKHSLKSGGGSGRAPPPPRVKYVFLSLWQQLFSQAEGKNVGANTRLSQTDLGSRIPTS
jgi:hypothetical protein